jgi:arylsulfatase A-like enzyme
MGVEGIGGKCSVRDWVRSDLRPAAIAGLLLGSALGILYGASILAGAYDPWLAARRWALLYPSIEGAWWAAVFAVLAVFLGVIRRATAVLIKSSKDWRVPGALLYGVLATATGVLMVRADWRDAVLDAVPAGHIGVLGLGLVAALLLSRVRPPESPRGLGWAGLLVAILMPVFGGVGLAVAARVSGQDGDTTARAGGGEQRPNVLLISVDALRTDGVRFVSDSAPLTPFMDKLASEGIVFTAAFAQAPWTLPSFASMMTSRYPSEVGVSLMDEVSGNAYPLSSGVPTLAEVLSSAGYQTVAQVTNPFLKEEYSVCRGFAEVRHSGDPRTYMQRPIMRLVLRYRDRHAGQDARDVSKGAIAWLEEQRHEPFFMWVHYLDPHEPYGAPSDLASGRAGHDDLMRLAKDGASQAEKAKAREQLRELYDREVTYCDEWIGRLLEGLDREGLRDGTCIILTADHGEAFWEYGARGHGRTFHDEVLRVPLVIVLPNGALAGERVEQPVRLLDIMPTVLALAGVDTEDMGLRGLSLLDALTGEPSGRTDQRELLAECRMAPPEQKALRWGDTLLLYQPDSEQFSSYMQWALPGVPGRAGERHEAELHERLLEFTEEMERRLAHSEQSGPTLSSEHEQELKALGYL